MAEHLSQEQIDRYLLGRLEGPELRAFEQQIASDPLLGQEIERQKALLAGMQAYKDQEILRTLDQIHAEVAVETQEKEGKVIPGRWFLRIAAILIVLVLPLGWYILFYQPLHEHLFASYFQPLELHLGTRNQESPVRLTKAGQFYIQQEWKEANTLFEQYLSEHPLAYQVKLYAGISQMGSGDYTEAIRHFETILERKHPLYADQARWYLALLYLKQKNLSSCKQYLKVLQKDPQADHHEDAKSLLEALER